MTALDYVLVGFLVLLGLAGLICVVSFVFITHLEDKDREAVLANRSCVSFDSHALGKMSNALIFWGCARMLHERCAESGHKYSCRQCQQRVSCTQGVCCGRALSETTPETIAKTLDYLSFSKGNAFWKVHDAMYHTEDIEDVIDLFSPNHEVDEAQERLGRNKLYRPEVNEANGVLLTRCRELVNKDYEGIPFALRRELAEQNMVEKVMASKEIV